jgi:uncharacterized protein
MSESHLNTILALHQTQQRLRAAQERLAGVPDWMRELHEEHVTRNAEIEALEQSVEEARLERRAAEGEIGELQEKLKRYQQQINEVQNQREYGALLQEIDTTKREIQAGEERGFTAMEVRDQAEKDLEEARQSFTELDQRYASEQEKWEAEKPGVRQEAADLEAEVERLRKDVPRPYLSLFDRLDSRFDGEPLAEVRRIERLKGPMVYHCSACNYRVRPQTVVEIRGGSGLVPCDSCKRLLFVGEEPEEDTVA